ncbi:MAG: carboxypeptidase-like regulatory domain-containing protein [Bacteroidota bacterium]
MKRSLVLAFFIHAILTIHGQSISVKGKVTDASDSSAIAFSNIYIQQQNRGTHSNESGDFILNVPYEAANDTLIVSAIGYRTFSIPVAAIDTTILLQVRMKQETVILDDVVIKASRDTLGALIQKAISRIPRNYPKKTFYLDGFYRELVLRDSLYVRFLEAAIGIQDKGFDNTTDGLRARVLAVRKSEDYINYSLYTKVYKLMYGEKNNLYETFKFDKIRTYNNAGFQFLESITLKPYVFELDSILSFEGETIYVIQYAPLKNLGLMEHGKIYLNVNDYAITRFEYNYVSTDQTKFYKGIDLSYRGNVLKSSVVEYRKRGKKYYLNFIKWTAPVGGAWVTENEEGEHAVQFYDCAFYVNAVYTKKRDFEKIKKRDSESREVDLYAKTHEYDADFWNDYNMVLINPLYEAAKSDLEKDKKLEQQYYEN